ncbi:hypothetical protein FPQ18DRAFT_338707 [Pyronema domesticum]|nr:hypothetical protein FPQ18DRAFT_338707 [Pyronema domesticum]
MEAKSQYHHFIPRFVLRDFAADPKGENQVPATAAPSTANPGTANPKPKRKNRKKKKKKKKPQSNSSNAVQDDDDDDDEEVDLVTQKMDGVGIGSLGSSGLSEESNKATVKGAKGKQTPKPTEKENTPTSTSQQAKPKPKNRRRYDPESDDPKNPLIKYYNLETLAIEERRVARAYGIQDMYRDVSAADANHIENTLATLEQSAAQVIRFIKEYQKNRPTSTVTLTRIQLMQLRKFLFVMKYRNGKFWRKYSRTMEEYDTVVDKERMATYMREKKLTKPIEVWLRTLKVILDTKVDAAGSWRGTVMQEAFEDDAIWYILHMRESYLAFCEPANAEDEFIITENGFGIHEGPTRYRIDEATGTQNDSWYTEYHKLAPLSPKLLLILRSNFLRKENKEALRKNRMRPEVSNAKSLFEDLPVEPATPSYGMALAHQFIEKDEHTFAFKIHKVSREYLDLFNGVLLQEAKESITWRTDSAMQRTLDVFLQNSKLPFNSTNMFVESKRDAKFRLSILLNPEDPLTELLEAEASMESNSTKDMQRYFKLGGTPAKFMGDVTTANMIQDERSASFDRTPKGPQHLGTRNAKNRLEMMRFSRLPPRVIYFHVKLWRSNAEINAFGRTPDVGNMDGPEGLIADLAHIIPAAYHSRLMLEASMKAFFRKVNLLRHGTPEAIMGNEILGFSQWGGICSSCFLENTPLYTKLGEQIMSSKRSKKLEDSIPQMFETDWKNRKGIKKAGLIEEKWAKTEEDKKLLKELLWTVLWPCAEDLPLHAGGGVDEPECVIC